MLVAHVAASNKVILQLCSTLLYQIRSLAKLFRQLNKFNKAKTNMLHKCKAVLGRIQDVSVSLYHLFDLTLYLRIVDHKNRWKMTLKVATKDAKTTQKVLKQSQKHAQTWCQEEAKWFKTRTKMQNKLNYSSNKFAKVLLVDYFSPLITSFVFCIVGKPD